MSGEMHDNLVCW